MIDKQLIAERFARARATYSREARVQQQVAEKMIHLLQRTVPDTDFDRIAEFGCGTGLYSQLLYDTWHPAMLYLNDLCREMQFCLEELLLQPGVSFTAGDAEAEGRRADAARIEKDKGRKAQIFHNMGVIFHTMKEYEKAIEAYKESLRNNPNDDETKVISA